MKTKKLIRKMRAFLSADRRAQAKKVDSLDKILIKLEKKEASLREKLDGEDKKSRRQELLQKLEVLEAQRKKGKKLREELEATGDDA